MALGFFRRRQKLVIGVMVVLMVAFLIPTGIRGLLERDRGKQAVGNVGKQKITLGMLRAAERDLDLLSNWLALGRAKRLRRGERIFAEFMASEQNHFLSWTLLLQQAGRMGVRTSRQEVDEFLARSGYEGRSYHALLVNLSGTGYTEKQLRRAVGDYLLVMESFESAVVFTPPSVPELRHTFRDLSERIRLAMVTFPAEDFLRDVRGPTEQEVREWFDKYKNLMPNDPRNRTDFRFGYRLPDRLDVAYLFIDSDRVEEAVDPSRDQMLEFWRRNRGRLTKKVLVAKTTTQVASAPATAPASAPAGIQTTQPAEPEYRQVVIERFSEAMPQIRRTLKAQLTGTKMSEVSARASDLIDRHARDKHPYARAASEMIHQADALLARPVKRLGFRTAPLARLIEHLEEVTRVRIVYPFGEHGKWSLDEGIKVEVEPEWSKLTLGEALARISAAHKYPKFEWVTCEGFESVIFPSAPIDLVPISSGRTGTVGFDEIARHELLGAAGMTKDILHGGQTLLSIAASVKEFQGPEPRRAPLIEVGGDFHQPLYVSGRRSGRLLWRLVAARRAQTSQELTDRIRRQIVEDFKTLEGFQKARAAAEAMKAGLDAGGNLEKLAEGRKRKVVKTDPLSRKTMYREGIGYSHVPGIGLSHRFIEKAFELVPDDPEPPHRGKPSAVVPLPDRRKVVLVQRIDYEPSIAADFQEGWRFVAAMLIVQRRQRERFGWFSGPAIVRRVGYVAKRAAG